MTAAAEQLDARAKAAPTGEPTHENPLVQLAPEFQAVLYRALGEYCGETDQAGLPIGVSFDEWARSLEPAASAEQERKAIIAMVQALRAYPGSYTVIPKPEVAAFIEAAERRLRQMSVPVLLELREQLKHNLNGR